MMVLTQLHGCEWTVSTALPIYMYYITADSGSWVKWVNKYEWSHGLVMGQLIGGSCGSWIWNFISIHSLQILRRYPWIYPYPDAYPVCVYPLNIYKAQLVFSQTWLRYVWLMLWQIRLSVCRLWRACTLLRGFNLGYCCTIAWPSGNSPTKNHEDRPRGSPPPSKSP